MFTPNNLKPDAVKRLKLTHTLFTLILLILKKINTNIDRYEPISDDGYYYDVQGFSFVITNKLVCLTFAYFNFLIIFKVPQETFLA